MSDLPSPALLTALLEGERALGRLAETMQHPDSRRRLWADAARREACAAARLDGIAVDSTDFLIATIDSDLVPTAGRGAAQSVRALWQGCRFAQGILAPPPRRAADRSRSRRTSDAAADAWQAVAELEAGFAAAGTEPDDDAGEGADEEWRGDPASGSGLPSPWTLGWLEASWRVLQAEVSGRDPARLVLSAEKERDAGLLLDRLEAAGRPPALLGAVGQLAELLRPAPDLRLSPWLVPSARLLAALAPAHACRVPQVWLPASVSLWTDRTAAGLAARGSAEGWLVWLADMVAESARRERQRAYTLDLAADSWRRRIGSRRRNSRLPEVLDRLFEEPAFTVRRVQKTLGTTFRGAQLIVDDLIDAGIVREVTNRALDRVFVAIDLMP